MRTLLITVILALYLIVWWLFPAMPYFDLPNHVTRCYLIGEVLKQSELGQLFTFDFHFMPYILGDLLLAGILQFTSIEVGGVLWVTLAFISLPIGVWFYLRALESTKHQQAFAFLLSTYLSTSAFFLFGYNNFCISIGLTFIALGCLEIFLVRLERREFISALLALCLLFLSLFSCYLMHLAGYFFCAIIAAVLLLSRLLSKRLPFFHTVLAGLPFLAIALYHVATQTGHSSTRTELWELRPLLKKFPAFGSAFIRFDYPIDIFLFSIFAGLIVLLLISGLKNLSTKETRLRAYEHVAILLALLVTYFALPVGSGTLFEIDVRALPFISICGMFLALHLGKDGVRKQRFFLYFAIFLSLSNLAYIVYRLKPHNDFLSGYNQALMQIPVKQTVLPISTIPDEGRYGIGVNAGTIYTLLRHGLTPYIFSGNNKGEPFTYFNYRNEPYEPFGFWYIRNLDKDVQWDEVQKTYDYIVITKPYDRSRIGLTNLKTYFENPQAVVFQVAK